MAIYIILYFILFLFVMLTINKENKLLSLLASFFIIIIPALRDIKVGSDTINYTEFFKNISWGYAYEDQELEMGYKIYNNIIRAIYIDVNFFLFITALLSLFGILFLIYKNSDFKLLSLLFFVLLPSQYFLHFSILRQSIAISFFAIALYYLNVDFKEYKYKILVFILISCLFHTTVFFLTPLLFISKRYLFNKKTIIFLLIISFIIGLTGLFDFRTLLSVFSSNFSGFYWIDRMSEYSEFRTDFDTMMEVSKKAILMLPFTAIALYFYMKEKFLIRDTFLLQLFITGVLLRNLIISYPMMERITAYLFLPFIIILPNYLGRKSFNAWIIYLLFISYYFWVQYGLFIADIKGLSEIGIAPYKFFFN